MKYTSNLIPKMTDYKSRYGEVICSGVYTNKDGFLGWNAFDRIINIDNSRWASQTGGVKYIGYKFTHPVAVCKYNIFGEYYDDAKQSPRSWILEASNNGKFSYNNGIKNQDYFVLDNVTNQMNWSSCEKRGFLIDNEKKYTYYVFTNLKNNGGVAVSIEEIEMFGVMPPYYLLKDNDIYYSLRYSFYELGQPKDNIELEKWYKQNGIDDLNVLVEKKNSKAVDLKLDKNDIYRTVTTINLNEITDKIEYINEDNKKEIKYNTEEYQLLDLIKKDIGSKFQIGKWEEK